LYLKQVVLVYKTSLNPQRFIGAKSGKWAIMYLCVKGAKVV
jgi:hypothetical protein